MRTCTTHTQGQIGGISRLSAGSSASTQLRTDAGTAHATAAHAHVDWAGRANSPKVLEAVMPPASWRSKWPQRQRAGQQRAHTESRGCVASHVSRPAPPFRCDWAWYLRQHGPHTCTQYRRTTLVLHRGARGVQAALAQQRGAWRAAAASFTWATTSLPSV
jgi:hypothetical protein